MAFDWLGTLKVIAPTVATALGGPLAGAAVSLLGDALGVSEPTQEKIASAFTNGQLTGEQIAKIKVAELKAKSMEKVYGFKFAELEIRDRDSARQREVATKDSTNKVLAYLIVVAFVIMVGMALFGEITIESALAGTLVGYLSAKCEQVLAYYFGSSVGSKLKTDLLSRAQPVKD